MQTSRCPSGESQEALGPAKLTEFSFCSFRSLAIQGPSLPGSLSILLSWVYVYLNFLCLCLHIWHFASLKLQIIQCFLTFASCLPHCFPADTDTCFLAFFGAEILSELCLTFNICTQWIFRFQKVPRSRLFCLLLFKQAQTPHFLWFSVSTAFLPESLNELVFAKGKAMLTGPLMYINRNSITTQSLSSRNPEAKFKL